jgi:hypothetical protein
MLVVGKVLEQLATVDGAVDALLERLEVVLGVGVLDVSESASLEPDAAV